MNGKTPAVATAMAILVCHGIAFAEDPAAADALFKTAVAALKTGDLARACPSFAESQRLDPRPGTLVAMADCEADAGRIATAVTLYDDFLRTVAGINSEKERQKYLERVKRAQRRRDNIAKKIPELTLVLPPGVPTNVRMTRNGEPFTATSLGLPIPVDPGEHVITMQLATGPVSEQRITIAVNERQTIELKPPVVESKQMHSAQRSDSQARGQTMAPVAALSGGKENPASISAEQSAINSETAHSATAPLVGSNDAALRRRMRTTGIVVGGAGLLGLATGIVAGSVILRRKAFIEENCPNHQCNLAGFEAASSLPGLNVTNAVGLAVGGAALLGGAVMFGWGTKWFGLQRSHFDARVGVIVVGTKDAFVGVKGAF